MKLNHAKQVKYLKNQKNIGFNIIDEKQAAEILKERTYYYKVTCYRKNFRKNQNGQYENVEFALLNDMAVLDMRLRYLLLQLTLDLEHVLKTNLINSITNSNEDGFTILTEFDAHEEAKFIASLRPGSNRKYQSVQQMLIKNPSSESYDYSLTSVYNPKIQPARPMPIWVFLEKAPYNSLIKFTEFYTQNKKPNYKSFQTAKELLLLGKRIRDSAAHNRPILLNIGNDIHAGTIKGRISNLVEKEFQNLSITPKNTSEYTKYIDCMKNIKVHDIFCLLILHKTYVKSQEIKDKRYVELKEFVERCSKYAFLYSEHQNLKTVHEFFKQVVHKLN